MRAILVLMLIVVLLAGFSIGVIISKQHSVKEACLFYMLENYDYEDSKFVFKEIVFETGEHASVVVSQTKNKDDSLYYIFFDVMLEGSQWIVKPVDIKPIQKDL